MISKKTFSRHTIKYYSITFIFKLQILNIDHSFKYKYLQKKPLTTDRRDLPKRSNMCQYVFYYICTSKVNIFTPYNYYLTFEIYLLNFWPNIEEKKLIKYINKMIPFIIYLKKNCWHSKFIYLFVSSVISVLYRIGRCQNN